MCVICHWFGVDRMKCPVRITYSERFACHILSMTLQGVCIASTKTVIYIEAYMKHVIRWPLPASKRWWHLWSPSRTNPTPRIEVTFSGLLDLNRCQRGRLLLVTRVVGSPRVCARGHQRAAEDEPGESSCLPFMCLLVLPIPTAVTSMATVPDWLGDNCTYCDDASIGIPRSRISTKAIYWHCLVISGHCYVTRYCL